MKMGTCAECGQPMHRGTTSLPQGVARCRACRATTQRTPEETRERKREYARSAQRDSCPDCGGMKWRIAERCRLCADKAKIIRAEDDSRLLRKHRESAAPTTRATSCQRAAGAIAARAPAYSWSGARVNQRHVWLSRSSGSADQSRSASKPSRACKSRCSTCACVALATWVARSTARLDAAPDPPID